MVFDVDVQLACDEDDLPESCDQISTHIEAWVTAALQWPQLSWQRDMEWQEATPFHEAAQLTVRIVGLQEGESLNRDYRQRQGATNVLSFPFAEPFQLQPPLLGDIVVCAPCVVEEAQQQGKPLLAHWAHLVVHGVLHLLGYDHLDDHQAQEMEGLEVLVLAQLGYPDPYNEQDCESA